VAETEFLCAACTFKRQQAVTAIIELNQNANEGCLIGQFPTQYRYLFSGVVAFAADSQVSEPFHQLVFEQAENRNSVLGRLIEGNMKRLRIHAAQLAFQGCPATKCDIGFSSHSIKFASNIVMQDSG
jgi:hypothetical protein